VGAIGRELRALKEKLVEQGVQDVNAHEDVMRLVVDLKTAKAELPADSPLSETSFKKEKQKAGELKKKACQEAREKHKKRLKEALKTLKPPHVQRKIYHMFATQGAGETFQYVGPVLNNDLPTAFSQQEPMVLTEKWDGTTYEATSRGIYQRLDHGQKAAPEDRYELTLRAWREGDSWEGLEFVDPKVVMALRPHLDVIAKLEDGLCVYFEICHRNINVSFRCLEENWCALRVFDFSDDTGFLPYDRVRELMNKYDLPCVGTVATVGPGWTQEQLWEELRKTKTMGYQGLPPGPSLEGLVLRSGHAIAKARVEYFTE